MNFSTQHLLFVMGGIGIHGPTLIRFSLIKEILSRGLKVDIAIPTKIYNKEIKIPTECQIITLESSSIAQYTFKLWKHLHQNRYDGVIANSWPYTAAAIIACTVGSHKIPVAVSEHVDFRSNLDISGEFTKKDKFILRYLSRFIYKRASVVIGVSQGVLDGMKKVTGLKSTNTKVIYNPLRTINQDGRGEQRKHDVVAQFWSDSSLRLLAVGRIVSQKDYAMMVRALCIIRNKLPEKNAKLVIAGSGTPDNKLAGLISHLGLKTFICFTGSVKSLGLLYKQANIFLMTSSSEGFGNVLVEALSYGLPIVATDCLSGPSEILANGKYGTLTPVGDPQEFANGVIAIVDSYEDEDKSILINRAKEFHVKEIASQYLAFLNTEK